MVLVSAAVKFQFATNDLRVEEGVNASVSLRIVKDKKVRLANPVNIRVTSQTVDEAMENGLLFFFQDENPLSPNRATGEQLYSGP